MKFLSLILCIVALEAKSNESVSESVGKDVILRWNKCHNEHDANCFASLFNNDVRFYSKDLSNLDVVGLKSSLFEKHPNFSQVIDEKSVSFRRIGDTLAIRFVKIVEATNGRKQYPSYLLVLNISDSGKIVAESDEITDKKLGVSRDWGDGNSQIKN
jgi:hypothetical protein